MQSDGYIAAAYWVPFQGHVGLPSMVDEVQEGQHQPPSLVALVCWEAEAV